MTVKRMWILLMLLSLLLSGCDYQSVVEDVVSDLVQQMTDPEDVVEPFIGFSETKVEDASQLRQLQPSQLENYTSKYCDYNSYTYFAHLNETEQLLYHAYEYALDEALPYFWIDDRLLEGMERPAVQVLEFLALDSAVVEQNFSLSSGGYSVTHSVFNVQTASEDYTAVYVENFSREKLEHKLEALRQAKGYLSQMEEPETATQREVAEYIYDWLGTNVTYETDLEGDEYLYSALCEGKTNCDGYTNAFALMCALAEIPCIEINSDTPEEEMGHTWNVVYLENRWVYVDATGAWSDALSECENRRLERVYFGFSQELLEDRVAYADLLPSCPEGLTPILHIPSGEVEDFYGKVKQSFRDNEGKLAVILVEEGDLEDQITEELATELDCDLQYIHFETAAGKTVYYLFENDS